MIEHLKTKLQAQLLSTYETEALEKTCKEVDAFYADQEDDFQADNPGAYEAEQAMKKQLQEQIDKSESNSPLKTKRQFSVQSVQQFTLPAQTMAGAFAQRPSQSLMERMLMDLKIDAHLKIIQSLRDEVFKQMTVSEVKGIEIARENEKEFLNVYIGHMTKIYAEMRKFKDRQEYFRSEDRKETVKKTLRSKLLFFQEETEYQKDKSDSLLQQNKELKRQNEKLKDDVWLLKKCNENANQQKSVLVKKIAENQLQNEKLQLQAQKNLTLNFSKQTISNGDNLNQLQQIPQELTLDKLPTNGKSSLDFIRQVLKEHPVDSASVQIAYRFDQRIDDLQNQILRLQTQKKELGKIISKQSVDRGVLECAQRLMSECVVTCKSKAAMSKAISNLTPKNRINIIDNFINDPLIGNRLQQLLMVQKSSDRQFASLASYTDRLKCQSLTMDARQGIRTSSQTQTGSSEQASINKNFAGIDLVYDIDQMPLTAKQLASIKEDLDKSQPNKTSQVITTVPLPMRATYRTRVVSAYPGAKSPSPFQQAMIRNQMINQPSGSTKNQIKLTYKDQIESPELNQSGRSSAADREKDSLIHKMRPTLPSQKRQNSNQIKTQFKCRNGSVISQSHILTGQNAGQRIQKAQSTSFKNQKNTPVSVLKTQDTQESEKGAQNNQHNFTFRSSTLAEQNLNDQKPSSTFNRKVSAPNNSQSQTRNGQSQKIQLIETDQKGNVFKQRHQSMAYNTGLATTSKVSSLKRNEMFQ